MHSYLTAHISSSAVRDNLRLLRNRLAPSTGICVAAKADCYGHGLKLLLDILSQEADCLAVATHQEAATVRQMGYRRPLLVFFCVGACGTGSEQREIVQELVAHSVSLTVVSIQEADLVAEVAKSLATKAGVHVKLDTGMGRSGVNPEGLPALVAGIRRTARLELAGVYTHFAVAEEADKTYTLEQLGRYRQAVAACGPLPGVTLHTANSAATIDLPQTHLDMVRPGIAVYGYQPSGTMHVKLPLRPALRLIGRLVQAREVPVGAGCGHRMHCQFPHGGRIGLVPIGYGDGYPRTLADRSAMFVRGRPARVRAISMDVTLVDLSEIPSAQAGDAIEIISDKPLAANSAENLARLAETIPYEITCGLGSRIRRVLVDDFAPSSSVGTTTAYFAQR